MKFARSHGSSIAHFLPAGTLTTLCGKDARLMARWSPAEAGVDARTWKRCTKCDRLNH